MLKLYVERGSDPVLQPVNVNVFVSEPKEDLSSELSSNSVGPTDTTHEHWCVAELGFHAVSPIRESTPWPGQASCWSLSICFRMFPQGQIRSMITTVMLAMLIQLRSTLTAYVQVSKNTSRKRLSICSRTTSSSQVTVAEVLPVYLFLNQMEATERTAWLKPTRSPSRGRMTALIKWEKLNK